MALKEPEGYTLPEASPQRKLTFGEKAVGLTFNPDVNLIKADFAKIIDALDTRRAATFNPEVQRMLSIAINEAQTAEMWAVKAVTWQY